MPSYHPRPYGRPNEPDDPPDPDDPDVVVSFERIGRHRPPVPVAFHARDWVDLAGEITRYARKFLASRGVSVEIYDDSTGIILAGGRNAGLFSIEPRGTDG